MSCARLAKRYECHSYWCRSRRPRPRTSDRSLTRQPRIRTFKVANYVLTSYGFLLPVMVLLSGLEPPTP